MNKSFAVHYAPLRTACAEADKAFTAHGALQVCSLDGMLSIPVPVTRQSLQDYLEAIDPVQAELALPDGLRRLIWELHSGSLTELLDDLLAMEGLLPDPRLANGGFFQPGDEQLCRDIPQSLPRYQLDHRLSLLASLQADNADPDELVMRLQGQEDVPLTIRPGQFLLLGNCAGSQLLFNPAQARPNSPGRTYLLIHYYAHSHLQPGREQFTSSSLNQDSSPQ